MSNASRLWLVVAVVLGALAGRAGAQTSSALVLVPWQEGTSVETLSSLFGYSGDTGSGTSGGADVDLLRFRTIGRFRTPAEQTQWGVGWDINYLDIDTNDALLPDKLADQAVAGGFRLGEWNDWQLGATVGVGYAGDSPFSDPDAWYALGSLMAWRTLDNGARLTVLLDYDGNRNIFPDVPLPGVAYAHRVNEQLRYTVGLPVSTVVWTPDRQWRIQAGWVVPLAFNARVDYRFHEQWAVFGQYLSERNGYWIDGGNPDRRLFFKQDRLEAGLRFNPAQRTELVVAGGYAFSQRFERGFDTRSLDTVREISDEPYVRLGLRWAY